MRTARRANQKQRLPPFDLVFCLDDPDEIVFVLGAEAVKEQVLDPDGIDIRLRKEGLANLTAELDAVRPEQRAA